MQKHMNNVELLVILGPFPVHARLSMTSEPRLMLN